MDLFSPSNRMLLYVLSGLAAVLLLLVGYYLGRSVLGRVHRRALRHHEQEMFTVQKGMKTMWEQEKSQLSVERDALKEKAELLAKRLEEYRRKLAGFGALHFGKGKKRSDILYSLLLENEALEEALYAQNDKLKREREEFLTKELKNISHRRVLLAEIFNEEKIKAMVQEFLADDARLAKIKSLEDGTTSAKALEDGEATS